MKFVVYFDFLEDGHTRETNHKLFDPFFAPTLRCSFFVVVDDGGRERVRDDERQR